MLLIILFIICVLCISLYQAHIIEDRVKGRQFWLVPLATHRWRFSLIAFHTNTPGWQKQTRNCVVSWKKYHAIEICTDIKWHNYSSCNHSTWRDQWTTLQNLYSVTNSKCRIRTDYFVLLRLRILLYLHKQLICFLYENQSIWFSARHNMSMNDSMAGPGVLADCCFSSIDGADCPSTHPSLRPAQHWEREFWKLEAVLLRSESMLQHLLLSRTLKIHYLQMFNLLSRIQTL